MKNFSFLFGLILCLFSFSNCKTSKSFSARTADFPKSVEDAQMRADFHELREHIFVNTASFEEGQEFSETLATEIKDITGELTLSYKVGDVGSTKVFFKTPNFHFCVHLSLGEGGKDFAIWSEKFELVYEPTPMIGFDNDPVIMCHKKKSSWEPGEVSPNQIVAQARKLFIDH